MRCCRSLYQHGLLSGDVKLVLRAAPRGGAAVGLSSIRRPKARFEVGYKACNTRDVSDLEVVYWWADGRPRLGSKTERRRC